MRMSIDEIDSERRSSDLRQYIRGAGIHLAFYDGLDSYEKEFQAIANAARKEYPQLIDVLELSPSRFSAWAEEWPLIIGPQYPGLDLEFIPPVHDYGPGWMKSRALAFISPRIGPDHRVCPVIVVNRGEPQELDGDRRYAVKVAALLHEVGHLIDMLSERNFDFSAGRVNIIEAEVFAHLYCLSELARRDLWISFNETRRSLLAACDDVGCFGVVARRVIDQMPPCSPRSWVDEFEAWELANGEL
jgi:hypothetical protein